MDAPSIIPIYTIDGSPKGPIGTGLESTQQLVTKYPSISYGILETNLTVLSRNPVNTCKTTRKAGKKEVNRRQL